MTNLVFDGSASVNYAGSYIIMNIPEILNESPSTTSGSIEVALWLTSTPYTGGQIRGYQVATVPYPGTLSPGSYYDPFVSDVAFTQPPVGNYYATLALEEYTSQGYVIDNFLDFSNPESIGGGGGNNSLVPVSFFGAASYSAVGNEVSIGIPQITNTSGSGTTGSLQVDLWFTNAPYSGGTINGYEAALVQLGTLGPGFDYSAYTAQAAYTPPPSGYNDAVLTLEEWNGGQYVIMDHVDLISTQVLEDESEITALYESVLGRDPDAEGLAALVLALESGASFAQIRSTMADSAEAQSDLQSIYNSVLGRAADSAGLAAFTNALAAGASLASVRVAVADSAEAQSDLQSIYNSVLGRAADSAGLAAFTNALAAGASLASVRVAVADSAEAQSDLQSIYNSVLGRAADSAGLAAFTNALAAGASLASVRVAVADSAEAQSDLQSIYNSVLGRAADSAGLAAFTNALAAGASLASVRVAVADSAEAQDDVETILTKNYRTSVTASQASAGQLQLASGLSLVDLNSQTLLLAKKPVFLAVGGGTIDAGPGPEVFYEDIPGYLGGTTIQGFNPSEDILQFHITDFPNVASVISHESSAGSGLIISLGSSNTILLQGLNSNSLTSVNLNFV